MSGFGENIRLTVFGQSHSAAVGMTLEGIPAGELIDMEELSRFLSRRAPGRNSYSTQRKEADVPEFLGGLVGNVTCGSAITAVIRNTDCRPGDYERFRTVPRPGHADYTAHVKYGGFQDVSGGGSFSGRLTAPLCVAGGICRQLLAREGIRVYSGIVSIGEIRDPGRLTPEAAERAFPVADAAIGKEMLARIERAKAEGDSVGGVIECMADGIPAGLGGALFDGMESRISAIVFGIPAVKGIEFGSGFGSAGMKGSENNDAFCLHDGEVRTVTNHAGGILGGITDGMPLVFRVAVKPTPSIALPQKSVDLDTMTETEISVAGRHDPCIVPRAVPCVEAAACVALYDALQGRRKETR